MCRKKNTLMIITLAAMVLFAVNCKLTLVQGQSMAPTLKNHQLMLVLKNQDEYKKDDIITLHTDDYGVCVKRIVADGGSEVELKDGNVFVNGVRLSPYTCDENLSVKYELEDDQYFVIGDNYQDSTDSREYGPIKEKFIIGKAVLY